MEPINIIFLSLTIFSLLLSYIFYIKSKKSRLPFFISRSFNLIWPQASKMEKLKVIYDDQKIESLTVTKLALWNKGKETIDSDDVAPIDPIRISVKNPYKILDTKVIYQTKVANNFRLSEQVGEEVEVQFDFFHKDEGVIIQILHTGLFNSDIVLKGTIKGVNSIKEGFISSDYYFKKFARKLNSTILKNKQFYLKFLILLIIITPMTPLLLLLMVYDKLNYYRFSIPSQFEENFYKL